MIHDLLNPDRKLRFFRQVSQLKLEIKLTLTILSILYHVVIPISWQKTSKHWFLHRSNNKSKSATY